MLSDILMWNKIGRIVSLLSKRLNVLPECALDAFYCSSTCERLHNGSDTLYLMSDRFIADEFIRELQHQNS